MTLRLRQVVLDSTDVRRSAEFWRQLLRLVYREPSQEGEDWINLHSQDGVPVLAVQEVNELAASTWPSHEVPQQLHLDLTVDTMDELRREHDRVLQLGGQLLLDRSDDDSEPLYVFGDPDGHPFCVFVSD